MTIFNRAAGVVLAAATSCAAAATAASPAVEDPAARNPVLGAAIAEPAQETFSADDIVALFARHGVELIRAPYAPGDEIVSMTANLGPNFQVAYSLLGCASPATGETCVAGAVYTGRAQGAINLDMLNAINLDTTITKAFAVPEDNIVIFRANQFFGGGARPDNLIVTVNVFLQELEAIGEILAPADGAVAEVSLSTSPARATRGPAKASNFGVAGAGAGAPRGISLDAARATAIFNGKTLSAPQIGPARE